MQRGKRTAWQYIPKDESFWNETDVEEWNTVEVGRMGVDSILSIGYDLRNRSEMEDWATEYGFEIKWR